MSAPASRRLRWIAALIIIGSLGLVVAVQRVRPPAAPDLPQPNGYEDFVAAGEWLASTVADYQTLDAVQLREFNERNARALARVRVGLGRECRVPMDASPARDAALVNLANHKRLVEALLAEGRWAALGGHASNAVASYLDALRLSHEAARGGLLMDHLVSLSSETKVLNQLQAILPSLDAQACRQLLPQLDVIETRREPAEDTLRMERLWFRRTFGFWRRIQYRIVARAWDPTAAYHLKYVTRLQGQILQGTQLRLAVARRMNEIEHRPPPPDASAPAGR